MSDPWSIKKDSTNLSSCIDNFRQVFCALVSDTLGEGVLDGRVVAIYKMSIDKLHGKR